MARLALMVGFSLLLLTSIGGVARADDPVVKVDLLANVASIQRGVPFLLGVRLTLQHPWHVYWKNPGDSGLPTAVDFHLPPGFEVGELRYPLPVRFDQPGDIVGYGYEREVVLIAEVRPPGELEPGQEVAIAAEVEFLRCADVCIPGKARPAVTLPVSAEAAPANAALFSEWMDRLPVTDTDQSAIAEMVLTRSAENSGNGERVEILARWRDGAAAPPDVRWFPNPDSSLLMEDVRAETRDDGKTSVLSMRLIGAPGGEPIQLPVLVTYTDATGARRGVETVVQPDR